jgi:hypothetical protein
MTTGDDGAGSRSPPFQTTCPSFRSKATSVCPFPPTVTMTVSP